MINLVREVSLYLILLVACLWGYSNCRADLSALKEQSAMGPFQKLLRAFPAMDGPKDLDIRSKALTFSDQAATIGNQRTALAHAGLGSEVPISSIGAIADSIDKCRSLEEEGEAPPPRTAVPSS